MLMNLLASGNPLDHVVDHPLDLGLFTFFSRHVFMEIVAALILISGLSALGRRQRVAGLAAPKGCMNFVEAICEFLRTTILRPILHDETDRFVPYLWTAFFFVLMCNLLGLIPVVGATATGNIWTTGALATCTLLMIVVNGLRLNGRQFLAHFCPGPLWLAPLLVPVEILGLVAKIFALTVRLFANMVAGHILLAVLLSFILSAGQSLGAFSGFLIAIPCVLGSVAVNMLELFVAFLQAFVFTMLSGLFIAQAVVHHGDEEAGEHATEH